MTTTTKTAEDREAEAMICRTMIDQIGRMNLLAISGGRVRRVGDVTMALPVRYGYSVEVEYVWGRDTYDVRRVFTRGAKRWVKGTVTDVYAEEVGEIAYRASCYLDEGFGN